MSRPDPRTHLRVSPNGVDHLMIRGRCATCGLGPHGDWPRAPYVADAGMSRPPLILVVVVLCMILVSALEMGA